MSSTLDDLDWNNSTALRGDVVTEVAKLKQTLREEIAIPASYQLGHQLTISDGLAFLTYQPVRDVW